MVNGKNSFVLCGDAEKDSEKDMLDSKIDLKADVLKLSHHGSRTSSSPEFLEAVSPSWAVISCGKGNSYGHPHEETLKKYAEHRIQVLRTDEKGTIIASSSPEGLTGPAVFLASEASRLCGQYPASLQENDRHAQLPARSEERRVGKEC